MTEHAFHGISSTVDLCMNLWVKALGANLISLQIWSCGGLDLIWLLEGTEAWIAHLKWGIVCHPYQLQWCISPWHFHAKYTHSWDIISAYCSLHSARLLSCFACRCSSHRTYRAGRLCECSYIGYAMRLKSQLLLAPNWNVSHEFMSQTVEAGKFTNELLTKCGGEVIGCCLQVNKATTVWAGAITNSKVGDALYFMILNNLGSLCLA